MLRNGFQFYFQHFGEVSDFDQIWNFGPLAYCRNTSRNQRYEIIFKNSIFANRNLSNLEEFGNACTHIVETVEFDFSFQLWRFGTSKVQNFRFVSLQFWEFGTLKFWNSAGSIRPLQGLYQQKHRRFVFAFRVNYRIYMVYVWFETAS